MNKFWKFSITLCLILLAFVVVGKALAAILDERINVEINKTAENYGLSANLDKISFVSLNSISIDGFELALPKAKPFFKSETLKINFNLLSYMLNRPFVSGVKFFHSNFILRKDEDGEWELEGIKRTKRVGTKSKGSSKLVYPFSISAENFNLSLETPSFDQSFAIDELSGSADPAASSAHFALNKLDGSLEIDVSKSDSISINLISNKFPLQGLQFGIVDFSTTRVTASAEMNVARDGEYSGNANGFIDDIALNHKLLSRGTAPGFSFSFDAGFYKKGVAFLIRHLDIGMNGETVTLAGSLANTSVSHIINMKVFFKHTKLDPVFKAIPKALTPHLDTIAVTGEINGEFDFHFDSSRPENLDYGFNGKVDRFSINVLGPAVNIDSLRGNFMHIARLPGGETKSIRVESGAQNFVPYKNIPLHLVDAVLTAEDGSFFYHNGFSPRHIKDSLITNIRAGRVVRGASTISMQLAKNLFLSRERTFSRKIEEALITMALEEKLDKKRMLEIYLNIIEWGPDVFGIGPASSYYFNKPASNLTELESAFLASIIARPNHAWGRFPLERLGEGWMTYIRLILGKMFLRGHMSLDVLKNAGLSDTHIQQLLIIKGDTELQEVPISIPQIPASEEDGLENRSSNPSYFILNH